MAYPILTGSIVEVILFQRMQGQQVMNVLHYQVTSASPIPDGKAALDALNTNLNSANIQGLFHTLADFQVDTVVYESLQLQWISPSRFRAIHYPPSQGFGNLGEAPAPIATSVVIQTIADEATRHGRGGVHLAGMPASFNNASELSAAGVTALAAFLDALIMERTVGALTYTPVIYNRANPAASLPITNGFQRTTLRTMRRRVLGRGI